MFLGGQFSAYHKIIWQRAAACTQHMWVHTRGRTHTHTHRCEQNSPVRQNPLSATSSKGKQKSELHKKLSERHLATQLPGFGALPQKPRDQIRVTEETPALAGRGPMYLSGVPCKHLKSALLTHPHIFQRSPCLDTLGRETPR